MKIQWIIIAKNPKQVKILKKRMKIFLMQKILLKRFWIKKINNNCKKAKVKYNKF
jgi:hypothetical protein